MTHTNPWLEYADCVSVHYECQKKDTRMDTMTQMASQDATLCGVRQWAAIVQRIRGYPGENYNTPVSTVWRNGKMEEIRSQEMITDLQSAVLSIREEKLGILSNEIGTHLTTYHHDCIYGAFP